LGAIAFKYQLHLVFNNRLKASLKTNNVISAACMVHLFDHGFKAPLFFHRSEEAGKSWRLFYWNGCSVFRFGGST